MSTLAARVLIVIAALLLTTHLLSTVLYVLPLNPVKLVVVGPQNYIQRYFSQDWGMFAPNPVSVNMRVLIRCVGSQQQSPLLDASSGFSRNHKLNIFAAQERVGRVIHNQAFSINNVARNEEVILIKCKAGARIEQCSQLTKNIKRRNEAVIENEMAKTAKVFCNDMSRLYPGTYSKFDLYIGRTPVARWSERWNGSPQEEIEYMGRFSLAASSLKGIWQ